MAHETSTPSRSSRKSQCKLRAWCSWITNLCLPSCVARWRPMGSGVFRAFRLARYVSSDFAFRAVPFSEAFAVTHPTVPKVRATGIR